MVAMGDAIIPVKDVGPEPEIKSLKLINPDSGKFEGEVRGRWGGSLHITLHYDLWPRDKTT